MWHESISLESLIKWDDNFLPTAQLKGSEISRLLAPCVYGWQRGNEWLYIGFSAYGLARVFSSNHHIFSKYTMWDSDIIYLWQPVGKSADQLKSLEMTLITVLEPRYNRDYTNRRKPREDFKRKKKSKVALLAEELLKDE